MNLRELLEQLVDGRTEIEEAERFLKSYGLASVGYHRLDLHRGGRSAVPEVVFGLGKSIEQLIEIGGAFVARGLPMLITKVDATKGEALVRIFSGGRYHARSALFSLGSAQRATDGKVVVLSAGSSDAQVADEAAGTLEFFGARVERIYDCGVAGLHRLFASGERISDADVAIIVAGMDGALPSVVGGLFRLPIIAVPTSVGYGAAFEGLAALLTMMNSCAPGVTVVNIDNGFGAAVAALSILQMAYSKKEEVRIGGSSS
jgi:NCAIR mutase (PurE)-related protein